MVLLGLGAGLGASMHARRAFSTVAQPAEL